MAKACATCRTRLLVLRGFPPLDHKPSADGKVAVTFTDPVQARWLARDEKPGPLEKRHAEHVCPAVADPEPGLRGEEWRKAARGAIAGLHRHQRAHRAGRRPQEITGYVKPPPQLPGMPGRNP